MSVLTNSQVVNRTFEEIMKVEFAPPVSTTPTTTVIPTTVSRGGALARVVLILMTFVVAGFAAVLALHTVGFTPDVAAQPTYTGSITIVPAKPASPIVRSVPAPKVVAKQTVRAGTTTTPQFGPLPKTAVVGRTGTATVARPQTGTQNQAAPASAPMSAPQPQPATQPESATKPATQPESATKPATQPKPVTDNGSGTTTPVAATPIVPPAPPASAPVATVPAPKPQPVAPTTNTTVVNSSPDGPGTTGTAVTDQGTGSQSAGSQMPQGTGPGAYNPGSNAGPSF